jgi:two-component system, OmpR family, sensor histidine kinase CpxA
MNRRLFWKIFLPFWVAQALLLGALYLRLHIRLHSERPWWTQASRQAMPQLGQDAALDYERGGRAALDDFLTSLSIKGRASYWLLDSQGRELCSLAVPGGLPGHAMQALQSGGAMRLEDASVVVTRISTARAEYLLVAEFIPPPLSERVPGDILWTLKLGTIVSAFLCLLIAHYLSKPIERLRTATNELARGNLDIRVSHYIGNRRDEIAELVRDFDSMADELRKLIQSERSLLSGVSHELRSPIARIRLALTLARDADARERREMLDRIEQDTIQLDSMLEKILIVARLEGGQHKPKFEQVSLREIVEDVLDDARFEATAVDVDIRFAGSPEIELNGDPGLLRSAVENIVRNAIFYSGTGGKIEVSLRRDNGTALLSVRDDGPGVPEESLPLLFKPFYRVDNSRGVATGGMGLGLAIVRNAVLVHGGTITAQNVVPHGLQIEVSLPIAPMAPRPTGAQLVTPLKNG